MVSYVCNHFHINVTDLDKALEFYQEVLGARLDHKGESLPGRVTAALDLGGFRLLVSNKLYPLGSPVMPGCVDPHMGLEHFGLQVADFDQAVADLKAKGVEFLMEPHEFRPGSGFKIAFIKGPDDVRIEIQGR